MRMVLAVVVLACGSSRPAPAVPSADLEHPDTPARTVSAETVCGQYVRLLPTCQPLQHVGWTPRSCIDHWREFLEVASQDPERHAETLSFANCLVQHDECKAAMRCFMADQIDPTQELRACDDHSEGSAGRATSMPPAAWAQRRGAGVTTFRDAASTKALPIEMCGIPTATEWLTTLVCDDQSRPLQTRDDAASARSGNVGPGGRCQSIIDRYRVTCPEASYEIYIDAYVCPQRD
jgi:hypothetical protein